MIDNVDVIQRARGRFFCMAGAYAMGVFNDNFFKQAALILAVAAGQTAMQGFAVAVFTLPFVLLAAPAGWAADRFPKCNVVIAAKGMEFIAMLVGAIGVCLGHWWLLFAMLAIMGIQATFFSPALNGSLPELYPAEYVPRANAVLRMLVTVAILGGVALAGVVLDRSGTWAGIERGRWLVGITVVAVALAGLVVSFGVPHRPAANPGAPFPWNGVLSIFRQLRAILRDPILGATVGADVLLWFGGSIGVLILNPMGIQQFQLGKTMTSGLVASQLVGIGIGGFLGGRLLTGARWYRGVPVGAALMGLFMLAMLMVPRLDRALAMPVLFGLTLLIGVAGGLLLIPVESFLQVRPAAHEKGAVLAAVNFAVFGGIFLSGFVANFLNAHCLPTTGFAWTGALTLVVAVVLKWAYGREGVRGKA
jgi:MFS family permease